MPVHVQRLQNAHATEKHLNYHIGNVHFCSRVPQRYPQALVCSTSSMNIFLGHTTPHCYASNSLTLGRVDNRR